MKRLSNPSWGAIATMGFFVVFGQLRNLWDDLRHDVPYQIGSAVGGALLGYFVYWIATRLSRGRPELPAEHESLDSTSSDAADILNQGTISPSTDETEEGRSWLRSRWFLVAVILIAVVAVNVLHIRQEGRIPMEYGESVVLDALFDGCADRMPSECDMLFLGSWVGSDYHNFAQACGGVLAFRISTPCQVYFEDFSALRSLRDQCEGGFFLACDLLVTLLGANSPDADIAMTCGGRGTRPQGTEQNCFLEYGFGSR